MPRRQSAMPTAMLAPVRVCMSSGSSGADAQAAGAHLVDRVAVLGAQVHAGDHHRSCRPGVAAIRCSVDCIRPKSARVPVR
jgi:hypothetical protein